MKQEDKELLLNDLGCRLLYGVKVHIDCEPYITTIDSVVNIYRPDHSYYNQGVIVTEINSPDNFVGIEHVKPYLRPMSSMTEEEYKELKSISPYYGFAPYEYIGDWCPNYEMTNWLNKKMFDYRGLIEKGLALEY